MKGKRPSRLDPGGFAEARVPGERNRTPPRHDDAPLSRRGKMVYYGLLVLILGGGIILIMLFNGKVG
ncbi:MAG: hypothetical protein ABIS18_00470 [Actinomycetota bacterium]